MATIQSIPVRQQHRPSMIVTSILKCYYHFGLRSRTSYLFTWLTRLTFVHFLILLSCVCFCFWPTLVRDSSPEMIKLSFSGVNSSSVMYMSYELTFAERCSLSLTQIPVKIFHSYTSMIILNTILCLGTALSIVLGVWLFSDVSPVYLSNPYHWFCWCRKILIFLVCSSIFNQLASATACRPIEILYDLRYQSMIMVQLLGFFICLLFSFFLGVKFASIKSKDRL